MPPVIQTRIFTQRDQRWFAECSGDFNPVHLDPIAARRELPGAVVAHGIHFVLWLLDSYWAILARRGIQHIQPARVQCSFRRPVYLDIPVEAQVVSEGGDRVKLAIVQEAQSAAKCSVTYAEAKDMPGSGRTAPLPKTWNIKAVDVPFEELAGRQGSTPLVVDEDEMMRHFRHLSKMTGLTFVSELLAITRIVGMDCPGRHSMLSAVDLSAKTNMRSTVLRYVVEEADSRMHWVTLGVMGPTMSGSVTAFYRPGPVVQMNFEGVKKLVPPGSFRDQRALVIGGARGIGEATAKLIAAGSGDVWLTYKTGEEDARAVCQDIILGGGLCRFSSYRTGEAAEGLDALDNNGFRPTHVYYFATPRLVRNREAAFNMGLFTTYAKIYVAGFAELYEGCTERWRAPVVFFYPSSVAVHEHTMDLVEYSCAKAAGEALCASLNQFRPVNRIHVARLPLIATELSRGLLETESENAAEAMLPILRAMNSRDSANEVRLS